MGVGCAWPAEQILGSAQFQLFVLGTKGTCPESPDYARNKIVGVYKMFFLLELKNTDSKSTDL